MNLGRGDNARLEEEERRARAQHQPAISLGFREQADMAHIRQSKTDSRLGLSHFQLV